MNRTDKQKALREHQKAIKAEIEEIRAVLQEERSELADKQLQDYANLADMLIAFQDEFARLNGGDDTLDAELAELERAQGQKAKNEPEKDEYGQPYHIVTSVEAGKLVLECNQHLCKALVVFKLFLCELASLFLEDGSYLLDLSLDRLSMLS